jgi:hypothetical protein
VSLKRKQAEGKSTRVAFTFVAWGTAIILHEPSANCTSCCSSESTSDSLGTKSTPVAFTFKASDLANLR